MTGIAKKLQAILDAQIGKGNIYSIVAAVQSHSRSIDFVGAAGISDPWSAPHAGRNGLACATS
jgi:hypothetical protein